MARPANKTPPELEAEAVRLIREGRTRRQVSEATGVSPRVLTRIAKDAGVEWARTGSGSNGTPETMAKARGVQSQYARNRRAALSERILDATEKTLDLMDACAVPRDRALLAQALRHQTGAYADLTQADMNAAPDVTHVQSMLTAILTGIQSRPPSEAEHREVRPDGSVVTYIHGQAVIYE